MAAGIVDAADDARRLGTIFDFWSRAAGAYRFDDGTHQACRRGRRGHAVSRVRRRDRGRVRAGRRRRAARRDQPAQRVADVVSLPALVRHPFGLSGHRSVPARRRPRPAVARVQPARRVALPVERGGLGRDAARARCSARSCSRDARLRVTDFGTSVTEPEDYWPRVEAFAFFDVSSGALVADRRRRSATRSAVAAKSAQKQLYRKIAAHGAPGQDRRGRVRVLHVPASVRRARGGRDRLDRAARQHSTSTRSSSSSTARSRRRPTRRSRPRRRTTCRSCRRRP